MTRAIQTLARELYATKEAELPVRVGLTRYLHERTQAQPARYDREGLAALGLGAVPRGDRRRRAPPALASGDRAALLDVAHKHYKGAKLADELDRRLEAAFGPWPRAPRSSPPPDAQALTELAAWARQELGVETTGRRARGLGRDEARLKLVNALDAKHRPEMREMEKVLVLQILDASWMEHLRAMDHLRSSIGLQGYAQVDPKVEYKREGMKIFAEMWNGVGDKVTDLIFRVEQFDPEFLSYLGNRWQLDRAETIHQEATSELAAAPGSNIRAQQEAAIAASQQTGEKKREPVRNVGKKVGRNDPCPCGSGKKFKACCMRKRRRPTAAERRAPVRAAWPSRSSGGRDSVRSLNPSRPLIDLIVPQGLWKATCARPNMVSGPRPDAARIGLTGTNGPGIAARYKACRLHEERGSGRSLARSGHRRKRLRGRDGLPGKDSPDAFRAQPDLPGFARPCVPLSDLPGVRGRGSIARAGPRRCWARLPLRIGDRPCVWFHAVSVGEVLLLRPLVERAGAAAAGVGGRRLDDDRRPVWRWRGGPIPTWLPSTPHSILAGRPDAPWPGSGRRSWCWSSWRSGPTWSGRPSESGAGVAIINGRLSLRSHRGYRKLRGPLGPTLRRLDAVAVQTEEYAERFVDLGVPRQRVRVTGSVKYDGLESDRNNPKTLAPPPGAGARPGRPGLRRRQHDGGRRGGGAGGVSRGAGAASEAPAGARATPRRAVREGRRLARAAG